MDMPTSIKARCSRQTEWRRPWKADAVRSNVTVTRWPVWVRALKGRAGVYLVRDAATKEILYVGRGRTCLKSSLVRHFHKWEDLSRPHHAYALFDKVAVEVKIYFVREQWVRTTEADVIALVKPKMNRRLEAASRTREPGEDDVMGWIEWDGSASAREEVVPF